MNLIKWWIELPWVNKELDKIACPDSPKRKRALTWKELFFRDKLSVLTGFFPLAILVIYIVWRLLT